MCNKKVCIVLLSSIVFASLFACGNNGSSANLDASTNINGAQLESISITPANPSIAINTDIQFTATGIYSDNTSEDLTSAVTWTYSAVDGSGVASGAQVAQLTGFSATTTDNSGISYQPGHTKATGCGTATIIATLGSVSASTTITVTSATLVSIVITPADATIVNGTVHQFFATGTFSDNTTQDLTTSVTWNSSNETVATISNAEGMNGLATSLSAGSITITATTDSISGTASLTVTAVQATEGTVTLAWDAPTTNTDGSYLNPVSDISLYKIYYGTSSHSYTSVVNITNPGTTVISKTLVLSPGTYYFAVTTLDYLGQESTYSNEAMKSID
jgi:hypothetical protein